MNSMTGFGRADFEEGLRQYTQDMVEQN